MRRDTALKAAQGTRSLRNTDVNNMVADNDDGCFVIFQTVQKRLRIRLRCHYDDDILLACCHRKCKVSRGARKYLRAPKGGKEGKRKGKRKEKGREGRRLLRLTSHIIIPYQLHKYITSTGCWSCCRSTDGSVSVCSNTVGQLCCLLLFFQKVSSQRY